MRLLNNIFNVFLETQINEQLEQQSTQVEETVDRTVNEVSTVIDGVKQFILEQGVSIALKILFVIVIYVVSKKVKKVVINIIDKAFQRSTMEVSVAHFIVRICDFLFSFVVTIAIVGYLGIDTSSLVALVGSAGLAVGLALQGSLSNFAGGVLILIMKPFKLGDFIITGGEQGVVTGIDIFYTRLTTPDNRTIVIPNGSLSNANIENLSSLPVRRVDMVIPVEYSSNLKVVKETLMDIASKCQFVINDDEERKPVVFVDQFEASDIALGFRVWVSTEHYWDAKWELMENVKNEFDEKGISIPFNQLEVNIVSK